MHWLTKLEPPPEMDRITPVCKERSIPGVRNCGSHIGQALLADEVVGIDFGENWISVDPAVDYDDARASSAGRRLPESTATCRPYLEGADPRSSRLRASDRRAFGRARRYARRRRKAPRD
jgi:hypothetical protein